LADRDISKKSMTTPRILLVGSGAREHALALALHRSPQQPQILVFASNQNPGIAELATAMVVGKITDGEAVASWAKEQSAELAIIGPEAPLETGVADALLAVGIPVVGPTQALARLESSKAFTRHLLVNHEVGGCPRFRDFRSMDGVAEFLGELGDLYVIKANGLMGGKGVKVAGDHLHSHDEAIAFCEELFKAGGEVVIEEKMIGVEFSLISLCGGKTLLHFPAVQDHKRAFEGDEGPNTGGMGSYSDADFSLPFLSESDIATARLLNERVAAALWKEVGEPYKGVLYGGFMATREGTLIVEYNARFGDPEVLNLMSLLEGDLVCLLQATIEDRLDTVAAPFTTAASVCKYAVPEGYPDDPIKGFSLAYEPEAGCSYYLGAVEERDGQLLGTGSRTVAVVALGATIAEAERRAERGIGKVSGPLFHRRDIGTEGLLQQRMDTMRLLRSQESN
jgi:phosphoribosylamine---glycine ligase